MVDLNEVHLTGRLVRDVELRRNSNGSPFVWFPLAVNGMKGKDGNTISDFINCQVWGKPAELLGSFGKKGARIMISKGVLKTFKKANEDGTTQSYTYVLVYGYAFLDGITKVKESSFDAFGEDVNF